MTGPGRVPINEGGRPMSDGQDWNRKIIEEFQANEGKVGGPFAGAPILLLHTRGAKTGRERVNPMMYLQLDGQRYVFASKSGADTNPDWYWNLVAHPDVTVEVGTETYQPTAASPPGAARIAACCARATLSASAGVIGCALAGAAEKKDSSATYTPARMVIASPTPASVVEAK